MLIQRHRWIQRMTEGDTGGGGGSGDAGESGAGGGGEAAQAPDWMGGLSEDLRGNEGLQGIDSLDALANGYLDASGKALKVPEEAGGYELNAGESGLSDEDMSGIKALCHEVGLSNDQAQKLFDRGQKDLKAQRQAREEAVRKAQEESMGKLTEKWGDDTKANIEKARLIVPRVFGENFATFMTDSRLGDNHQFIIGMHRIATQLAEDSFEPGGGGAEAREKGEDGKPILNFKDM